MSSIYMGDSTFWRIKGLQIGKVTDIFLLPLLVLNAWTLVDFARIMSALRTKLLDKSTF